MNRWDNQTYYGDVIGQKMEDLDVILASNPVGRSHKTVGESILPFSIIFFIAKITHSFMREGTETTEAYGRKLPYECNTSNSERKF